MADARADVAGAGRLDDVAARVGAGAALVTGGTGVEDDTVDGTDADDGARSAEDGPVDPHPASSVTAASGAASAATSVREVTADLPPSPCRPGAGRLTCPAMSASPNAAPNASAQVTVAASPQTVYGLLTDLDRFTELAQEPVAMRWTRGTEAAPGSRFRGTNRNGWRRWSTTCTVTDADPGRTFAFEVVSFGIPVARWQYDIDPAEGGCVVTESTWDRRPGWFVKPGGWATGVADRDTVNAANIRATLDRLKARAEAAAAPA